jgi:HAD superfamily hydrolase (TIGR01549 family)
LEIEEAPQFPSGLLIDLDGTIVDSVYLHVLAWSRALRSENLQVPAWYLHAMGGRTMSAAKTELERWTGPLSDIDQLRRIAARYIQELSAFYPDIGPCPGADQLLASACQQKVPIAIVTSAGKRPAEALLQAVPGYAECVLITAEAAAKPKPDPECLLLGAAELGVDVTRCWVIGDTEMDIIAAKAAGATPIGVRTGGQPVAALRDAGARVVLNDLLAVAELLRRCVPPGQAPTSGLPG